MTYRIVEVFKTLQGEGFHAGRTAVFVRFAGCNLWTGHDEHRARDAARHGAECPKWCDTDFRSGKVYDADALEDTIRLEAGASGSALVVFTGGEPFLQLDHVAVEAARRAIPFVNVCVETNGTVEPQARTFVDWICLSPKVPVDRLRIRSADELKVVFPDYDPLTYDMSVRPRGATLHRFIQPRASVEPGKVGLSVLDHDVMARAATFCMEHPEWRLSTQTHKVVGLR